MHQSVSDAFVRFSSPLEGVVNNPYLDVKGLVTVAIGCLIDPVSNGVGLPWVLPGGAPAPEAVVLRQLTALKAQPNLAHFRAQSPEVLAATTIRLTDAGVVELVNKRLLANEPFLRQAFPKWDTWPADAQLCACSIAWAVGAGWPAIFGNCARLLEQDPPQFLEAIEHAPDESHPGQFLPAAVDISTKGNPGIVPRNAQNELALSNAQVVLDRGLPIETLYWPRSPLSDLAPSQRAPLGQV